MSLREFMDVLWRRRLLLLVMMLLGAGAIWLVGRPTVVTGETYSGDVTLTATGTDDGAESLGLYAFIASNTSEISEAVAAELGDGVYGGEATVDAIGDRLTVEVIDELSAITITVENQPSESVATAVLQLFSQELIEYSRARRVEEHDQAVATLATREETLRTRIDELDKELTRLRALQTEEARNANRSPDPLKDAEMAVALESVQALVVQSDELRSMTEQDLTPLVATGPPTVLLDDTGQNPLGLRARMVLGIALGGVLGLGLILALHRFDTRLYSRKDAEAAFALPVLAEIPKLSWRRRNRFQLIASSHPGAAASEAYRLLRSNLARARRLQLGSMPDGEWKSEHGSVILVGSASASTGKSTTVANLAVAAVDAGKKVLVISADLRQPTIHHYLGVTPTMGLTDAVDAMEGARRPSVDVKAYVQPTDVDGVSLLCSGHPVTNPGERLAMARPFLEQARESYDLIFIDTPSMLVGNDVSELLPFVDLMLVVAKVGLTTIEEGQWTTETAERVQAPVCGVALIGSRSDLHKGRLSRLRSRLLDRLLTGENPFARTGVTAGSGSGAPAVTAGGQGGRPGLPGVSAVPGQLVLDGTAGQGGPAPTPPPIRADGDRATGDRGAGGDGRSADRPGRPRQPSSNGIGAPTAVPSPPGPPPGTTDDRVPAKQRAEAKDQTNGTGGAGGRTAPAGHPVEASSSPSPDLPEMDVDPFQTMSVDPPVSVPDQLRQAAPPQGSESAGRAGFDQPDRAEPAVANDSREFDPAATIEIPWLDVPWLELRDMHDDRRPDGRKDKGSRRKK